MGQRMAESKHQHIHHHTREVPPGLVQDVSDPSTPTGYVNYSLPWEAILKNLVAIIDEKASKDK